MLSNIMVGEEKLVVYEDVVVLLFMMVLLY